MGLTQSKLAVGDLIFDARLCGPEARSIISPQVRENYGLQIWLAFIGKPVRMSGRANELIGCFDEILRSHGGALSRPDCDGPLKVTLRPDPRSP
jgi:hypothetical protein